MSNLEYLEHPISPFFDENSTILILGSFPSVLSRKSNFYYGHPQNRFWKVLKEVFHEPLPTTIDEKKAFLKRHHIALWDVIATCKIKGSADQSIQDVTCNDISLILKQAPIKHIYVNGQTAFKLYQKYTYQTIKKEAILLPSTSPANAAYRVSDLVEKWLIVKESEHEYSI